MAKHSTRYKIKYQIREAYADLERAQIHLVQAAALADGRHPLIEQDLPLIVSALQMTIDAVDKFYLGL